MHYILSILLLIVVFTIPGKAVDWYSVAGQYARVEYLSENKATADSLLTIAERAIPRLAMIFDIPLQTIGEQQVRIILTGEPDVSNGYALADAVVIYELSSDYMLTNTGSTPWYEHVLLHELAHYFTFIKIKRKFNFFGELANLTIPRWFYEGIAQYYTEDWTTFRGDIYLRTAVLNGKLSYSALDNLDDGRLLYAAAHGFTRFLADQYGDSSLIKLMTYNADGWFLDFDDAFQSVYKKGPEAAFTDFTRHLVLYYGDMLAEYPAHSFPENISFGYRTFQVLPFSVKDSMYLSVVQEKSNHRYRSLIKGRFSKGHSEIEQVISRRIHTDAVISDDRKWLAYGRTNSRVRNNQMSLTFDWVLHNLETDNNIVILRDSRTRSAAFGSDENLILCNVCKDTSRFMEYKIRNGVWHNIFETSMPVGTFDIAPDESIVFSGQSPSGQRDLYLFKNGELKQLTNDSEDDRNPVFISDSLLVYNRLEKLNPAIAVYDLAKDRFKTRVNTQDASWIAGHDRHSGSIIISCWDSDRKEQFYTVPVDSILNLNSSPVASIPKEKYSSWTAKKPDATDGLFLPDTSSGTQKRTTLCFPQKEMIHLFSAALPTWDENLGLGIYGVTSWAEALQRQAFAGSFIAFTNKPSQSLVLLTHVLAAFNSTFLTSWYHGPIIFSHQDGAYVDLYQDYLGVEWQYKSFIGHNNRNRLTPSVSYSGYRFDLNEPVPGSPDQFSYHGTKIGFTYAYLLPVFSYPALPKRELGLSAHYFKSFDPIYNFSIAQVDLKLATNIMIEELGWLTEATWISKEGEIPAIQTIGTDRFYEFNTPRDFRFTKPVRGVRQDLSGSGLLWYSTELRWFLKKRTGYKLIFLPVNNIAASLFYDYARIQRIKDAEISGYGFEISFGEELYRLGLGYVFGEPYEALKEQKLYLRFNLIIPDM